MKARLIPVEPRAMAGSFRVDPPATDQSYAECRAPSLDQLVDMGQRAHVHWLALDLDNIDRRLGALVYVLLSRDSI